MLYVKLVVENNSNNTDKLFTYACTYNNIKIGDIVNVPFGKGNKIKRGFVFEVIEEFEEYIDENQIKFVDSIFEEYSLTEEIIETCKFIRNKYFCRYIEAIKLFLPVGNPPKRRKETDVINIYEPEDIKIEQLTNEQKDAVDRINQSLNNKKSEKFLLIGVTGSGKTEVYMQAVQKCIEKGKKAILLTAEISLTKQLTDRFIARFGYERIAILHSKMTLSERYDQWQKVRKGNVDIVIGARTAVFTPLDNIGLIILDEEHEQSYKSDKSPKYETSEVAFERVKEYDGSIILGSATPSVTSLYKMQKGEYIKLQLTKRYNENKLPDVEVVDMRKELKEGNRSVFSKRLYDLIKENLAQRKQIILMINKRGHSSFISCRSCGHVIKCEKCGIPMTYHKESNKLACHYCGRRKQVPSRCPNCDSKYIKYFGAGTQKIEEAAIASFPNASIQRLDLDVTKNNKDINKILKDFNKGKIDILVGTQIIGKGIDNKNVNLVGIMAIDTMLNIPNYRAAENTFQLITQAAGRAGRGEMQGKVVIQTYEPENYAVVNAQNHNVTGFYNREIRLRQLTNNPPFSMIIQISVMRGRKNEIFIVSKIWKDILKNTFDKDCILYERKIYENDDKKNDDKKNDDKKIKICMLVKLDESKREFFEETVIKVKEILREKRYGCTTIIDINPYNLWRN